MTEKIKVLIADDNEETRLNIGKLLDFSPDLASMGSAASGEQAIELAKILQPDIILMDINMPGMDGIAATEILADEVPSAGIIIVSVQGEQEYLRRAMIAGAKNYLTKPFTSDELVQAIKQVYENEQKKRRNVIRLEVPETKQAKVITVFSTKGGVGKTTIATNLAVGLAVKTGARVGLIDADLQFGDISLFLNIFPQATIADLLPDIEILDEKLLESYLTDYQKLVKVLAAPFRPEQAEMISGAHLTKIIKTMRKSFDYIVIDTAPNFDEKMLATLDAADQLLVVSVTDLPTIKNVKICLEVMESLDYKQDKIRLILNRAHSESGLDMKEVEESLRYTFSASLPSDGKTVVAAVNRGIPFVISHPQTEVSQGILSLARSLAQESWEEEKPRPSSLTGKIKRLFG